MKLITLLLTIFSLTTAHSQNRFPDRCIGIWKGVMTIQNQSGKTVDSVPVVFTVAKLDANSWAWKMEYKSEKYPIIKDYKLIADSQQENVYRTDEGDGIAIREQVFGSRLMSFFETDNILLTATYELRDTTLYFEVVAANKGAVETHNGVGSYPITNVQSVVLTHIE